MNFCRASGLLAVPIWLHFANWMVIILAEYGYGSLLSWLALQTTGFSPAELFSWLKTIWILTLAASARSRSSWSWVSPEAPGLQRLLPPVGPPTSVQTPACWARLYLIAAFPLQPFASPLPLGASLLLPEASRLLLCVESRPTFASLPFLFASWRDLPGAFFLQPRATSATRTPSVWVPLLELSSCSPASWLAAHFYKDRSQEGKLTIWHLSLPADAAYQEGNWLRHNPQFCSFSPSDHHGIFCRNR